MDIKQLLEKMEEFAGEKVGQKPGEQWRGTDKGTPGKKLVGASESVLKDLSKGPTAKTREQELAEEWANFNEEDLGTHPKRARRTSDRHSRGHEPQARYKTVKADEAANPAQQAAIAIAMKKDGKNPKNEGAEQDPIVAKVVKQMRPGLTGLNMGNEAFLYFAYELGKQRARDSWSDYLPAIRVEYEKGLAEGWESGPEEYKEPYDDADDAYDRQRQEKIDTEAEKEWAKLPKVSTYKLVGRGPNMEPNYEFGDEFDTLEQAVEYRAEIMKDPKTPHPEHIGIRTITRVVDKEPTDEAVTPPGSGIVKNIDDYIRRRDEIFKALADPKQKDNYPWYKQALFDLNRLAKQAGVKIEESRAHKQLDTWFKNRELAQKYASGEVKIPTPQERNVKIEKPKKQVKEYGANNPAQATTQKASPAQAQQVAANLNTQKTALGQLKQLNPDINPQKAAMAATKDLATMNPQEKEELAQVAKTLTPALGSPAFGSIKTALQKAKTS